MSSVDSRVVEMKFNSTAFGKGVADTIAALQKLQDALKLDGASKGAENAGKSLGDLAAKGGAVGTKIVDGANEAGRGLDGLGAQTSGLGQKFSALQVVAVGALLSIGSKALEVGQNIASALSVDPITSGLDEYSTNMNSIQTILANTQVSGAGLPEVNAALDQLNAYSDKTIYNFSEMARNIGTFTAAGVGLDQSVQSIKGIANLAALSGSSSSQAAGAMYQLSQAISAGKVSLMDWNSVVTAGMGGTVFQRALAQTAVAMGKLDDGSVKLSGDMQNVTIAGASFRDSIDASKGTSWLTSDVLVNTLSQFTGDLDEATLKAQGFTDAQIESIMTTARTASLAAQDVKTLGQVFDVAKETAGSGWSQTWRLIFGDFEEAKSTFTELSNAVTGFINRSAAARNAFFQEWRDNKGREALVAGFRSMFRAIGEFIAPIRDAFRTMFPPMTGAHLADLTRDFATLMRELRPSPETVENLRRTFAGVFAVLRIGWDLIKAGVSFFARLFGTITAGGGSILGFTGNIGDFLVMIQQAIEKGDLFGKFFDKLGDFIEKPIVLIKSFVSAIANMFSGVDSSKASGALESLSGAGQNLADIGGQISDVWGKVIDFFDRMVQRIQPFMTMVGNFFSDVGKAIGDFVSNLTFGDVMTGAGVGLGAALILAIRKFLKNFDLGDLFGGKGVNSVLEGVREALDGLTETLSAMQHALNATALLAIAAAIGVLTLSVIALSGIPAGDLAKATGAIAALVGELAGAAYVFKRFKASDGIKIALVAGGLTLLAVAVRVLASAVKTLAELSWNELAKGISGTVVLLGALATTMRIMPTRAKMISNATGILIIAGAIKLLASAVKDISDLDWAEIAKGVTGVAALLTALALYTKFARLSSIGDGAGILLLAAGIKVLASAAKDMTDLNWEEMARGMSGIAVGLGLIVAALKLLPETTILKAAGIVVVAAGLKVLASALKDMSKLDWNEMAKGLTGAAVGLAAMTAALKLIPKGAIFSAGSLLVTALALKLVGDTLVDFSKMGWDEIAKSLVELAGALIIIGLALKFTQSNVMGAASLLIVAFALGILGDTMTQFGKMGWDEIAKSLVELAAALLIIGVAVTFMDASIVGAAALVVVAYALSMLVPVLQDLGAMSWSDIGAAIGGLALLFVVLAIGGVLSPVILLLAVALGVLGLAVMAFGAGIKDIGEGVSAFADGIEKLASINTEGLNNLSAALDLLIQKIPPFIASIAQGIVDFAQTIADGAPAFGDAAMAILEELGRVIRDGWPQITKDFMDGVTASLQAFADRAGDFVDAGADALVNLLKGVASRIGDVVKAGTDTIIAFMQGVGEAIPRVVDAGFKMIIRMINGIADAIRQNGPKLRAAGANLVDAIFDGMFGSVDDNEPALKNRFASMATGALNTVKFVLGIKSPSRKFYEVGYNTVQGFVNGVDDHASRAVDSTKNMGEDVITAMGKTIAGLGRTISENMDDVNPVITPVLDLSAIQRDSAKIGGFLEGNTIDLSGVTASANETAAAQQANLEALAEIAANSGTNVNLTQNNYSPKALSNIEIYRQTNNQISTVKEELANAN